MLAGDGYFARTITVTTDVLMLLFLLVICPSIAYVAAIVAADASKAWYWFVVICATLMFSLSQYFGIFRPTLRARASIRNKIVKSILLELRRELDQGNTNGSDLRLNVMDVTGGIIWNRYLSIVVCTDDYSEAETDLKWKYSQGACGLAWKGKEQVLSDTPDSYPHQTLDSQQKDICRKVKCVLSTPIQPKHRRVRGILNIDSTKKVARNARLNKKYIQDIAQVYADMIAELY